MSQGLGPSGLETEIVQIALYVQARGIIAKALCRAYPPCVCQEGQTCHAETIYRREAETVLSALTKAGLLALNGKGQEAQISKPVDSVTSP